jgi:hypothetical protein
VRDNHRTTTTAWALEFSTRRWRIDGIGKFKPRRTTSPHHKVLSSVAANDALGPVHGVGGVVFGSVQVLFQQAMAIKYVLEGHAL